ncbi:copper homeostasis protein CutC [Candidatus Sororendozoicomonas aggregata]|uniref:copper homeostasis protein CutC n=1 Tax=Candidatus Sororendozoicomonas aggregata TaxID=3073239 RepID=UPI002ED615F6
MTTCVEVCVDSSESLRQALLGGANRIELCASLHLGGLTPSDGFMQQAVRISTVPVYAMIRPRQGDFLYSDDDIEVMLSDIHGAKQRGLAGIVVGSLTPEGFVNEAILRQLVRAADGMGVTFHRAIDQSRNPMEALEIIASIGCERVLTSGCAESALEGATVIKDMVNTFGSHLNIMAGGGVTAENVRGIIAASGVSEVHLSGKTTRPSGMTYTTADASMGAVDVNDYSIAVTCAKKVKAVVSACNK